MKTNNKVWVRTLAIIALVLAVTAVAAGLTRAQQTTTITRNPDGSVITVTVNNEPVVFAEASQPRMMSGRVMVPLRGVVERLGGNILYDAKTKVITGAHPGTSNQFRLRVGSDEALLNGKNMMLDAQPRVIMGTTYVPLRFVSEALGAAVEWNGATRTVIISADGNTAEVKT